MTTAALPDLPFSRPLRVSRLPREAETPVSVALDPDEATALARYLGVQAVSGLQFDGRLVPWQARGWRLGGRLSAQVTARCVVTLEPVVSDLSLDLERCYLPSAEIADLVSGPEDREMGDENAPEPLADPIEAAEPICEALLLAIDPYPRAEGAALGEKLAAPPGAEPLTDAAMRPFAGLAELKRKLESGD
ncbi:MAG: DUF177 domain-containing protein [Pikeienuella sp.]